MEIWIGMKAPRMMHPIDMNRGENKEIDPYNNYTLKLILDELCLFKTFDFNLYYQQFN